MFSYHPQPIPLGKCDHKAEIAARHHDWQIGNSLAGLLRIFRTHLWSPGIFRDGHRCQSSSTGAFFFVVDADEPCCPPLADALEMARSFVHICGTTRNHQKPKHDIVCDRYRLVIQMSERVKDVEQYRQNANRWIAQWKSDPQAACVSQAYWPCSKIVSISLVGERLAVQPLITKVYEKHNYQKGILPPWLEWELRQHNTTRGHRAQRVYYLSLCLFERGFTVDEVMTALLNQGQSLSVREIKLHVESASRRARHGSKRLE